jgi:hypothetical protein
VKCGLDCSESKLLLPLFSSYLESIAYLGELITPMENISCLSPSAIHESSEDRMPIIMVVSERRAADRHSNREVARSPTELS